MPRLYEYWRLHLGNLDRDESKKNNNIAWECPKIHLWDVYNNFGDRRNGWDTARKLSHKSEQHDITLSTTRSLFGLLTRACSLDLASAYLAVKVDTCIYILTTASQTTFNRDCIACICISHTLGAEENNQKSCFLNLIMRAPMKRLVRVTTYWISVVALGAVANLGLAMEPTPTQPTTGKPDVTANAVEPVATHIIIKYVENEGARIASEAAAMNAAERLSAIAGANIRHVRVMSGNAQVVELADLAVMESAQATESMSSIIERLQADPAIEYAEPDAFMQIQQVNDPQFGQQWHYTAPNTGVNLADGWSNATGNGVTVAVIDTGYRPHADLAGNLLLPGYDFISNTIVANDGGGRDADARDPGDWIALSDTWCPRSQHPQAPFDSSWHGTHVAGTVAAVTNNSLGVAGVARSANVVPVRVLGKCGGNLSDIADGMRWGAGLTVPGVPTNANPAEVLNLSLGGGGACGPTYQDAINDIVAAGSTVVVAAGNSNANASGFRPANCNGVVTVAATNQAGARSYYSNFGGVVEISAPGGETHQVASRGVLSTLNSGTTIPTTDNYVFYQGTSMAAPHVAGVAALLYQLSSGITPAQVSTVLQNTAQSFPSVSSNQCNVANCGAGIVDASAATDAAGDGPSTGQSMPWLKLLLKN